jgi:hypothetical protein
MNNSGVSSAKQDGLRMEQYILILLTITLQEQRGIGDTTEVNVNILLYIAPI